MKRLLLLTILLMSVTWSFGQQTAYVPDCNNASIFQANPCKVAVIKDGKTIGYTEKYNRFYATATLNNTYTLASIRPTHYKWIMFSPVYTKPWYIDNPDSSGGKYVMHLDRKRFKWLNDSTAVYSPDSLNKKNK